MRSLLAIISFSLGLHLATGPAFCLDDAQWRSETRWIGETGFQCISAACGGAESTMAMTHPLSFIFSLLDYEKLWRTRARNKANLPQSITKFGQFRRVDSRDETEGDIRHYVTIMHHREPNGALDFICAGYMARGIQIYELLAKAITREQAEANYRQLADDIRRKFKPQ